jgi:hypothetical protein
VAIADGFVEPMLVFPAAFQRQLALDRLGITTPDEIDSSHSPALSRPTEPAAMLNAFTQRKERP